MDNLYFRLLQMTDYSNIIANKEAKSKLNELFKGVEKVKFWVDNSVGNLLKKFETGG